MNPIRSFSQDMMQNITGGGSDPSGSVFAYMIQEQRLLNKEFREDHKSQRQTQAQELQREEQAQELQREEQAQQSHGFLQSIGNFLTGSDGGSGNGGTGSAAPLKVEQSSSASNDWLKFLKLR